MTSAEASALWVTSAGQAELRSVDVLPREGDAEIRTLYSGISRGTERLVFSGSVPESEHETMQAPFQEGAFSFPVKYGYAAVGELLNTERAGQCVFALYPHQSRFALPAEAAFTLPENVPAERAILAANMETALNITWDAGIGAGDTVAVVGCGVVGALVGYLVARIPGTTVTLIDIDLRRQALAAELGCAFAVPEAAAGEVDVVIHTSATNAGLSSAIELAGLEASIVEASWYGAKSTDVPLGGRFHQRRLKIISSQVGRIPAHRAARWTFARRLTKALGLLADPKLDALIATESDFFDLANDYGTILANPSTLCHRVRYDA
ncbi:zinc-dependent alcohol dehydrogenase [Aestuariibius sp. 2305UL40-4]|uniref:zinc-dependent alcohol dehydrogenase n=1 Tax=Aestuariibius violaceus TaxID=3234132 RepID=UPI00345EB642